MNALDIIVIAVVALSALFAFARGFVKEALSIGAWIGAALIAFYGLPLARPFAARLITAPKLADTAAGLAIFVVALIALSLLTSAISSRVKQSALSAVDRALGLLFGLFRGVAIVCIAFIGLRTALPESTDWPNWILEARTRPFLTNGADMLASMVPRNVREQGTIRAMEAQRSLQQAQEANQLMRQFVTPNVAIPNPPAAAGLKPAPSIGYKQSERSDMQRLIDGAQ